MALFQHNNRGISYRMELAPFAHDLVLLQASRLNMDVWDPLVEWLQESPAAGGRILICDWADSQIGTEDLAKDLIRLLQTLALQSVRVVAMEDAVQLVQTAQRLAPDLFEKTLLFAKNPPKGADLEDEISEFCEL